MINRLLSTRMVNPMAFNSHAATDTWRSVAASAVGTSHLADARPCQDAHRVAMASRDCLIAAVADGAGSAQCSELGARIAVAEAVESLLTQPASQSAEAWEAALKEAFRCALAAIDEEAAQSGTDRREYSTTLLVVVVAPQATYIASVGDCFCVLRSQGGDWQLPVAPARGEYANETTFLTSSDWEERLVFVTQPPATRLALLTDGLLRLALNLARPAPHPPFFESLFAFVQKAAGTPQAAEALEKFLMSERVNARTDDDKTLVMAWQHYADAPL